jgi:hypothetical protein
MTEKANWLYRCYHCDQVFKREAAAIHFGMHELDAPACKLAADLPGLIELLRSKDAELAQMRREDSPTHRQFYELGSQYTRDVTAAQEQGYNKALRDLENGDLEKAHAARVLPGIIKALTSNADLQESD